MQQFLVPQFIDVEDKIIGPITVRQFVLVIIAIVIAAIEYRLLSFVVFLPVGLITVGIAAILAFARVNGRPVHFFLLNFVQTIKRPFVRVWNKEAYVMGLIEVKSEIKEKAKIAEKKAPITGSRLQDLSLIINTGGVYQPEDQVFIEEKQVPNQ